MGWPGEQLVIKMWETLADKGIGSLLTPWQITREGKARNEVRLHELLLLAQAEVHASEIRSGRMHLDLSTHLRRLPGPCAQINPTVLSDGRIEPRIDFGVLAEVATKNEICAAAQKEINLNKAILQAEKILEKDAQAAPDKNVEQDWLFNWRDSAQRVSNCELQEIWGKILAGEVKSPGKYSLRTLEFLRGLSKPEADQISKIAPYFIEGTIFRDLKNQLDQDDISFNLIMTMQELGIVSGVDSLGVRMTWHSMYKNSYVKLLRAHGKGLLVEHEDPNKMLSIKAYTLTNIGKQMLDLGGFEANIEFLKLAGKEIIKQGFSVKLVDWAMVSEEQGAYTNEIQL